MKCKECFCITEVDGEFYSECEITGKCTFGDKEVYCPEEQLERFKENAHE